MVAMLYRVWIAFAALLAARGLLAADELSWDSATVVGRTADDRCFYAAGEEISFTLELTGVNGALPKGKYFLDWERTANDGVVERGHAPAEDSLVIRTKMDIPGFIKIEANVVDGSGKRVPKKHRWEKRVFFQGGVGIDIGKLKSRPEPNDFDDYWMKRRKEVDALPLKVLERSPMPCQNAELNLWRVKLDAPAGVRPATGYLAIPKSASAENRVRATGRLSGYYNYPEHCPHWVTNHVGGIEMYINRHGCELDQPDEYYEQFYRKMPYPPEHFRDMAYRAMLMFRFLKSLPEWNGRELVAAGSSGGGMQTFWVGMLEPQLTRIDATCPALADIFGYEYGRETGKVGERVEGNAYFDICNVAKRVRCHVFINAGLGDTVCPPAGLAIVYNNLAGPKQITWHQGATHGWWPKEGTKVTMKSGRLQGKSKVGVEELTVGGKSNEDPLGKLLKK